MTVPHLSRRAALVGASSLTLSGLILAGTACARTPAPILVYPAPIALDPVLLDLHRRTFDFFWDTTDDSTGLTPDRWPTRTFCSIAAVGFALTAYCIGVNSGYIARADAARRTRNTLRTFLNGRQGADAAGCMGYKGFFYHFLNFSDGTRYRDCELSSVDTSLFLMGALTSAAFFNGYDVVEAEIRHLAQAIYERVDWTFMARPDGLLSMGWHPEKGLPEKGLPEKGLIDHNWTGYCEGMMIYLLAMASPTHPLSPQSWTSWCASNDKSWGRNWGPRGNPAHLGFWPLFGHQYSHIWYDFRGVADPYMRRRKSDYFTNSRLATEAQRNYAIENPNRFKGYGPDTWGLTACDGPVDETLKIDGRKVQFRTYSARGPRSYDRDSFDDGTIAPTAAVSSIAFAPDICTRAAHALVATYGADIIGKYGFFDSFNLTVPAGTVSQYGHMTKTAGWVATDYLGIDQGPILAMLENARSGFVWDLLRNNPWTGGLVRKGMIAAGFQSFAPHGDWLDHPGLKDRA